MPPLALVFLICCGVATFALPRRWSSVPIVACVFFMTEGPGFNIGGAYFSILRILIVCAVIRVVCRGETSHIRLNAVDRAMIIWAVVAVLVCPLRVDAADAFKYNVGMIIDYGGTYLLFRATCRDTSDVMALATVLGVALILFVPPILLERKTGQNPFAMFGGVSEDSVTRDGKVRAQGSFQVYITTGTSAAVTIPLLWILLKDRKRFAQIAIAACAVIVFCCKSSGPILTLGAAAFGLWMWKRRQHLSKVIWAGVVGMILLELVMESHFWYVMAKIDLTGGSTGYHRSELITQALAHLGEWWLAGTHYTRHWMVTGIHWSSDHTDITNYYIKLGVVGGLPLLFALVNIIKSSLSSISSTLRQLADSGLPSEEIEQQGQLVWILGNVMFCHALTFVSVSYFDQIFVLFWMVPGVIASVHQMYALHLQPIEIETEQCPATSL